MNSDLLVKLKGAEHLIGNTPIHDLGEINNIKILAKLESFNNFNNLKARPAYYILKEAIKAGNINRDTIVVESSSGNFAVSLAALCNQIGLKFVPVIDPNINPSYENLLHTLCSTVIKVSQRDDTGGFLKTRLATVEKFLDEHPNSYWTNQYNNPNNFKAHYLSLGEEIIKSGFNFDYIFIAVSTLGTITGVSKRIKKSQPNCKTIAVDVNGSSIFNSPAHARYIPGIGSSIHPAFLNTALIDDHIIIDELNGIIGCWELIRNNGIFVGGSSGCVFSAAKEYCKRIKKTESRKNALLLFADGGYPYIDTIYNNYWIEEKYKENINALLK